ncbi:MAG: hypothetical protein PUA62_05925 [Lachnospiraceae bacterium]|nr:hypothetical protein [Lachnospiraceae bacterium]
MRQNKKRQGQPLPGSWYAMEIFKLLGITVGIAFLFYNAWYGSLIILPFSCIMFRRDVRQFYQKRTKRIRVEFKDFLVVLSGNLSAGYAFENAIRLAEKDMEKQYGKEFLIRDGIRRCVYGVRCNQSIDVLFENFAHEIGIEEATSCAHLMMLAKQYGGNMIQMLQRMARNMTLMFSAEQEIETSEAQKKLESRVMLLSPFGIVFYMRMTNAAYISMMYDTMAGHVVMTLALVVIGICGLWMDSITKGVKA